MLLNSGVGKDSWECLGQQGDQTSQSRRKSTLNIHWKGWCWTWSSSTLATWWDEPTYWKGLWCWERLREGGERGDREWDGWMSSPISGHVFEQTPWDSEGQGSLAYAFQGVAESWTQLRDRTTNCTAPWHWVHSHYCTTFILIRLQMLYLPRLKLWISLPAPASTKVLSDSLNLTILSTLYKWNQTVFLSNVYWNAFLRLT